MRGLQELTTLSWVSVRVLGMWAGEGPDHRRLWRQVAAPRAGVGRRGQRRNPAWLVPPDERERLNHTSDLVHVKGQNEPCSSLFCVRGFKGTHK